MALRPKARLIVKTSRPGQTARIITFTMVRLKKPTRSERCLAPGAKRTRRC